MVLPPSSTRKAPVLGYDMWSEPVRRVAMARAMDDGRAALTGRLTLVNDTGPGAQAAVLLYVPVYRPGAPVETLPQRRVAHVAWIFAPFRMNDLMAGILGRREAEEALELYDGRDRADATRLYRTPDFPPASGAGAADIVRTVNIYGRDWTLVLRAKDGLVGALPSPVPPIAAGGLLVSLLAGLLVAGLVRSRRLARDAREIKHPVP